MTTNELGTKDELATKGISGVAGVLLRHGNALRLSAKRIKPENGYPNAASVWESVTREGIANCVELIVEWNSANPRSLRSNPQMRPVIEALELVDDLRQPEEVAKALEGVRLVPYYNAPTFNPLRRAPA